MNHRTAGTRWWAAWLIAALLVGGCGGPSSGRTNLVMVCIDTVRADLFFHEDLRDEFTPWLASAQSYEQAMSVAPWTVPTVASVFTGLYPVQHGAGDFPGPVRNLVAETPTALSQEADTLAEILAREGYQTALFAAHPWLKPGFGLDQGFQARRYYQPWNRLLGQMLGWIEEERESGRPFFAYLHLMESHDLHRGEEQDIRSLLAELDPAARSFLDQVRMDNVCRKPHTPRCVRSRAYQLSVLQTRERLARILRALDGRELLQDTLVVVYSDHGEAFRERNRQHRQLQQDPRGMYGTGHGQYQFQELLHVPLLAWVPGRAGATHATRVSLVDVFPSILDWLGIPGPRHELPGAPLPLDGEPGSDRTVYASNVAYGPETVAIFSGSHKAMYWPHLDRFLFFDLEDDPQERRPLDDEGLLLEFSTLAGDYLALPRYHAASAPRAGEEGLRELQAIGYLQGLDETPESAAQEPDRGNEDG